LLLLTALTSPAGHLIVLAFGLGCVSWGALELRRSSQIEPQSCPACPNQVAQQLQEVLVAQTQSASKSAAANSTITVDVAGAVKKPGLYHLTQPARVADAIAQAGGFSESADAVYVAQKLNLATQLTHDSKVYIPSIGENWSPPSSPVSSTETTTSPTSTIININSASKTVLMELPGVGEVTAQKIISNRPYGVITELTEREVVTESVYNKIMTQISAQ
jgi:DNA uptake protein ComE-like DNA-binding protein